MRCCEFPCSPRNTFRFFHKIFHPWYCQWLGSYSNSRKMPLCVPICQRFTYYVHFYVFVFRHLSTTKHEIAEFENCRTKLFNTTTFQTRVLSLVVGKQNCQIKSRKHISTITNIIIPSSSISKDLPLFWGQHKTIPNGCFCGDTILKAFNKNLFLMIYLKTWFWTTYFSFPR